MTKSTLDPVLQALSLNLLVEEFNKLCELLKDSVEDDKSRREIQKIINELAAFRKVLQKEKEYSPEQVKKLTEMINTASEKLTQLGTPKDVKEIIEQYLSKLNRGVSPIKGEIKLDFEFIPQFSRKMEKIKEHCEKIDGHMKKLALHSPGHHHGPVTKLANAIHRFTKSVNSVFKVALSFAKDVQYTAKRAAAFTGLRKLSLEDIGEGLDREEKRNKKEKQENADIREGLKLLEKERAKEKEGTKPTVFSKKSKP